MRRTFLLLLLFLSFITAYSQAERYQDRLIAEKFRLFHNAGKVDSVYGLFSNDMQTTLPLDKAKEFLGGLKSQAGAIAKMEFVKYDGPYASYRTTFDKGVFSVDIALDPGNKIGGFFVKPVADESLPKPSRNVTKLQLPFKEVWTVAWGGDTKELNYHVENTAQKNAFDFLITDPNGRSFKTDGKSNTDYYAFGKPLYATCDGEVVDVIDGVADNKPGVLNAVDVTGNTVVLKTANNEYIVYAHFKQNSIKVQKGQLVKSGDLLGLCGNSGRSSEPHLHFHIQNTNNVAAATGIPAFFYEIKVDGKVKRDYSPIRKEKISAAE